jgi:2-polyprenyl-3-methyl-5-hydroxy-6-metoxy-1,4-benzoquinol methylase
MAVLSRLRRQARLLYEPAPMAEFEDFDDYWEQRGTIPEVFHRWVVAAGLIPQGARILDLGSGSGDFLRYLAEVRPDVTPVGSDSSRKAREMVEAGGFEAIDIDAMSDAIPSGFDVITAFEILEHLPDAELAIQRWCAASGSHVILSIPNIGYLGSRIRLGVFGRFPTTNCVYHIKEHVRHWTLKDFHEWTSRLGLRVTHVEAQYGAPFLRKAWPGLFGKGIVYRVETATPGSASASSSATHAS